MRVNPSTSDFLETQCTDRQTMRTTAVSQVTLVNPKLVMTGAAAAVTGGGTQVTSDPGCCLYTVSMQGPFVVKAPVVNIIVYKGQFNADFFTIIQFLLPFSTCNL